MTGDVVVGGEGGQTIDSLPHYFMVVVEVNPQARNTTKTRKGDKLTGSFPQGSLYFSSFCCLFNAPIDSLTEKLEKDEEQDRGGVCPVPL